MDIKGIARSLRAQLQHLGVELTHSQTLELMARTANLKDWNVLAAAQGAQAARKGLEDEARASALGALFCPGCGARGTVHVRASAFVEQGPGSDEGYLYEGDADHYVCASCGYQFLQWSSNWPKYRQQRGIVLMVEPALQGWRASAFELGVVQAVLAERSEDMWDLPAIALDPSQLVLDVNAMARTQPDGNAALIGRLGYWGVRAIRSVNAATVNDAVKALLSRLPPEEDDQVLNRDVGL